MKKVTNFGLDTLQTKFYNFVHKKKRHLIYNVLIL